MTTRYMTEMQSGLLEAHAEAKSGMAHMQAGPKLSQHELVMRAVMACYEHWQVAQPNSTKLAMK